MSCEVDSSDGAAICSNYISILSLKGKLTNELIMRPTALQILPCKCLSECHAWREWTEPTCHCGFHQHG